MPPTKKKNKVNVSMKLLIIIMILMMLLTLAGCKSLGIGGGSGKKWLFFGGGDDFNVINYKEGIEELEIAFVDNAPEDEVFEGRNFQIGVDIMNLGGYDITNAIFMIYSDQESMLKIERSAKNPYTFTMEGKSNTNPIGGRETLMLKARTGELSNLLETKKAHDVKVIVKSCYLYESHASPTICIDTDVYNTKKGKACETEDVSLNGQGAPVAVTNVIVKIIPAGENANIVIPVFDIFIENQGSGNVYHPNHYDFECGGESEYNIKDIVIVSALLEDQYLECFPSQFQLTSSNTPEERKYVKCSLPKGIPISKGTYTTPLEILLDYGYSVTVDKTVKIVEDPTKTNAEEQVIVPK